MVVLWFLLEEEGGAHFRPRDQGKAAHPQRAQLICRGRSSSSTEGAAHPQRAELIIHRGRSSSSTEGAAHPQRVQLIHRGRSSSTEGAPRGCEAFSVGSCQGASFSIEQNGNKCVLRNNPAKEWPSIEFFFIFNDLVARMNSKCQMKYLSTIKNRHVQLCYLNSMLLSSWRIEGCFRGVPTLPQKNLPSEETLWHFNPVGSKELLQRMLPQIQVRIEYKMPIIFIPGFNIVFFNSKIQSQWLPF